MADERQHRSSTPPSGELPLEKPLRCIVKLGGAAITCKNEIEKINGEVLAAVSAQLRQAMLGQSKSGKVLAMDWSRGFGMPDVSEVDDIGDSSDSQLGSFIVVHGAGSFGHFQASKSGVHKGGLCLPLVKAGFVATRISVTSLNLEIVRALAREGLPAVGMPPFACGFCTHERNIAYADLSQLKETLNAGFVPVLHGDAVFDRSQDCTILSGDLIIRHLAQLLKPDYIVFLTDVLGVYDRPPRDPDAVLLREIDVDEDGSWSVVKPNLQSMNKQVELTVASHDTTGGMEAKIREAALIAQLGIDVYITEAGTVHSSRALNGETHGGIPDDWFGTVIRSSRKMITGLDINK